MADLIPEPPDGAYVLVGEPDEQQVFVRDDSAAAEAGYSDDARWFRVDSPIDHPLLWDALTTVDFTRDLPEEAQALERVERLYTQTELDQAVRDGGYEDIGDHRIALGSGICVVHGETYALPHELDRLREREGGGRG